MKRNKYKYMYVLFLSIILSICVFSFINRNDIYAHENRDNTNLPAWRTSLSKEEAEKMEGCEVFVDSDKKEAIIRPKNGASEGVISYSIENKRDDFTTIRHALIFNVPDEKFSVRFDKHVYLFDSVEAVANDTLFFQMHPGTINITDNLNIQFAKNLATFFMQNYLKSADSLQYIKGIENWNTSHITDMKKMFNLASQLKGKLDLSKWDVSNVDNFNLMFSGVGNEDDSFVLDFSNKKFKNSVNVKNMFNSFRGVLIANNWSVKDPNGQKNPISELLNDPENSSILTFWNSKEKKYVGPSRHLLITDNTTILAKNKVEKYKFYKKPRVIYKDKSVELELPAVYDSRVDENGKPDTTKSASNDAMKVVKYQFDDALKKAILKLKTENPNLGLPNDYEAVPTVKIAKDDSPIALFQDYYLAEVKSETIEAKTIYTQDQSLAYMQEVVDSLPINGVKKIIMGQMEDGHWNPNLKSDETIRPAKNGKIRVGNKEVETIDVYPKTVYQADDKLDYKATQVVNNGTKGSKTVTTIYRVDPTIGLTGEIFSENSVINKEVSNKVIKVGNIEKISHDIPFKIIYKADNNLNYQQTEIEITGRKGSETIINKYKVYNNIGLTVIVEKTDTNRIEAVNQVVKVGNKKVVKNGDTTTIEIHEVDPNTGNLGKVISKEEIKLVTVKAKTKYEADDNLTFNEKKVIKAAEDGQKEVTTKKTLKGGNWVQEGEPKEKVIKPVQDGLTKVGNKEVSKNGNETITKIYEVNPDTGELSNPKVVKKVVVRLETISAKMKYEADENLEYNTKQKVSDPENGQKRITIISTLTNNQLVEGKPTEEIVKQAKDGLTKVGNKEVSTNGDETITKIYEVNPDTGALTNPRTHISRPIGSLVGSIKEVVIKANMKYEADETLPFNEKKVIKVAEDGKKKVQDTGKYVNGKWVKGTDIETIIKPVQDGLTKVGNKEVSTNGDETITKIYEVNPDTGELSNPKVTKTVKMARLVPAQQHHNNQQTMSHTVDTSDHSSLSYYGMFLSALSVLCLILFKKEKLN